MATRPTGTPTAPRRRLIQKVNQIQAQPTQITPSATYLEEAMPLVPGNIFGRLGKGAVSGRVQIGGPVVAPAAGNDVIRVDARGSAPGAGLRATQNTGGGRLYDAGQQNESPYGSVSGRQVRHINTPHSLDSAGEYARTSAFQHGRLIAHDRHIIASQGRTNHNAVNQQTGANPNPQKDGPPRPSWKMFNRTISHMYGQNDTRFLDNHSFHSAVIVTGGTRKFPLGKQGDEWTLRYGGTPGLANFRPYGHRGGFNANAPLPTVRSDPGGPYRFNTLLQVGSPLDGPQKVYGGNPWGLHSPTLPPREGMQSLVRSRLGQVKPVWNVRPLNSNHAGQSWSQSMVSLRGNQPVKLQATQPIRQPGINARWLGV